jgi:hypothetical protein
MSSRGDFAFGVSRPTSHHFILSTREICASLYTVEIEIRGRDIGGIAVPAAARVMA